MGIFPGFLKRGSNVVPLLTVFQRPPDARDTKKVYGRDSGTMMSRIREPCRAGPRDLYLNTLSKSSLKDSWPLPNASENKKMRHNIRINVDR
jgi:hypothetical protein